MNRPLLTGALAGGLAAAALAACGGSATAPAASGTQPASTAAAATIKLEDFDLSPMSISVKTGDAILVVNAGKAPHNLHVRDASGAEVAKTATLQPGQSTTLRAGLPAGSYSDFCAEAGHEALGMKGSINVT